MPRFNAGSNMSTLLTNLVAAGCAGLVHALYLVCSLHGRPLGPRLVCAVLKAHAPCMRLTPEQHAGGLGRGSLLGFASLANISCQQEQCMTCLSADLQRGGRQRCAGPPAGHVGATGAHSADSGGASAA